MEPKSSSLITEPGLPVDLNRDGLAVNSVDEAGPPSLGFGLEGSTNVVPSVADSKKWCNGMPGNHLTCAGSVSFSFSGGQHAQVSVRSNCCIIDGQPSRKPGLRTPPEVPLGIHTQAPTSDTSPTQVESFIQHSTLAGDSGTRPSIGSSPRREPHPFLMTKNALLMPRTPDLRATLSPLGMTISRSKTCLLEYSLLPEREAPACRKSTWKPTMPPSSYVMEN